MSDQQDDVRQTQLARLFRPRSIALIGATDKSLWSRSAFDNLRRFNFSGQVHLVNPKGGTIHGQPAVRSLEEIGAEVDAALLMVPASGLLDVFEDLRLARVAGAVVLSAGFAEAGAAGAEMQARMVTHARAAGVRLIGPNCLGFANFTGGVPIWATPLRRPMANAHLGLVSQSGALASQMEQFAYQQRIGIGHLVSTGNEADLGVAEVIAYFAAQSEIRSIAVFLETVRHPDAFIAAVQAAQAAAKTVVVFKIGVSEAAAKAAQAHTGSLVGNDAIFNAVCARHGIIRAHSMEELILTADLAARLGPMPAKGLGLAALSGGLCEIVLDHAERIGISLPGLQPATRAALAGALPEFAVPGNPLDLTGGAILRPETITASLEALAADPEIGVIAFVVDLPAKEDPQGTARKFISHIAAGFEKTGKACLTVSNTFGIVTAEARALADTFGLVHCAGGINLALPALANLLRHRISVPAVRQDADPISAIAARPRGERAVLAYLAGFGVPAVPATLVTNAAAAARAAAGFEGPVALKIASPDIAHKTDLGGVALGIAGPDAAAAYEEMLVRVRAAQPEARIEGVLVSPMRKNGTEIFVGTLRDPQWGPAIAVGLGGIWVEVLKDSSLRMLPVDEAEAMRMLDELRGGALLAGYRGTPAADSAALARAIAAIGDAALALGPDLVALEVNPLLAMPEGAEALDALAIWA